MRSVERDHGQSAALAHEAIHGRAVGDLERQARKTILEGRQLLVGLSAELGQGRGITLASRGGNELAVDCAQSIEKLATRLSSNAFGRGAMAVQFPDDSIEDIVECLIAATAERRQAGDDAIEMGRQRLMPPRPVFGGVGPAAADRSDAGLVGDPDRAPPFVEGIQNVRLAEFDPHRTATWSFGVVAFEVSIDSVTRNLQRHSPAGPPEDLLERGTDDANQMAIVLTTEVGLDCAAVPGRPAL